MTDVIDNNEPEFMVHPEPQGSLGWLAARALRFNAGDAAAMLSCSPHGSRTDLLDELVKGYTADVTTFKQAIYDSGHRYEALARSLGCSVINEPLYPLVCSRRVPDLQRRLGASCDGLTMLRDTGWEHKRLNKELREAMPHAGPHSAEANNPRALPKWLRVQCEQQLVVVSSMKRVLCTATDWSDDGKLLDERHCWYESDPALRAELLAGWRQFQSDLQAHLPVVHKETPKGIKGAELPALVIRVSGSVMQSNLADWRVLARQRIEAINTELKTDDDFGQAIEDVKWCKDSADRIKLLKTQVLEQMADVNEVVSTLDAMVAFLDRKRLDVDDLVERRKLEIRNEVAARGQRELADHLAGLTKRVPFPITPADVQADFAKAIKGKRTVKSLNDAVNDELTRCKLGASALADRMQGNLAHLAKEAPELAILFPDQGALCRKLADDFQAVVAARLSKHREQLAAAEARRQADEQARQQAADAARAATVSQTGPVGEVMQLGTQPAAAPQGTGMRVPPVAIQGDQAYGPGGPGGMGYEVKRSEPFVPPATLAGPPTLKLGTICERLGFNVTAAFLGELGFTGQKGERNSVLFHEAQFRPICQAIVNHVLTAKARDWSEVIA